MKKKIFIVAAVAICLAIIASGTLAFFTSEAQVHNVITTSGVAIQIEEWQDEIGNPYPEDPVEIMPGFTVSKIVTIKNKDAEAWVRAKFDLVFTFADDSQYIADESLVSLNIDGTKWIRKDGDDEWWYCVEPVATGDSTEPFFTEVNFDGPMMDNNYQNCTVDLIVSAQAVQTANNGTSVLEAEGWPID